MTIIKKYRLTQIVILLGIIFSQSSLAQNPAETKEDNINLNEKEIEQLMTDAKKIKEKKELKPRKKKVVKKEESESDNDSSDSEEEIIKPKKNLKKKVKA